ncbi:MAG: acylphosphatase [Methanothrix sp.]|nr:acylphosphatase [Methanothrix sp.]
MERHVIWVSGKVQKAGYRARVVAIAKDLGIKGMVENLPDGRVKVIAEGEEADLERFAEALRIRNALIDVTEIKIDRSRGLEGIDGFHKTVGEDETDGRLDKSAEYLKVLIDVTKEGFGRIETEMSKGFSDLGDKMDQMLDKQDQMLIRQDQMLDKQDATIRAIQGLDSKMDRMLDKQDLLIDKQDETTGEIRGLRTDLKSHIDLRFARIETDLGEVKTALRDKGII